MHDASDEEDSDEWGCHGGITENNDQRVIFENLELALEQVGQAIRTRKNQQEQETKGRTAAHARLREKL